MVGIILGVLIGLIAGIVVAVPIFGRLMEELPSIREQWREIDEEERDAIARWNRWGCIVQILILILLALLLIGSQMAWFLILLSLTLPLAFLLEGLKILKFECAEVRPLFRPLRFVTGKRANRRGRTRIAIGLLLLVLWVRLVVHILKVFPLIWLAV